MVEGGSSGAPSKNIEGLIVNSGIKGAESAKIPEQFGRIIEL